MDKRWRVVISAVVLFIIFVNLSSYFVLAASVNDNTKSYNSTTKTVTISYQNNLLGTVTLLDNSYYCNSYCYAILKVNTSISKQILNVDSSVVGDVNFLKKVGVSWLPDSLNYDILVGKKRILIQEINGNSTSYNISKEIIDWVPLKDFQISNGQEFYIKIEGYKDSKKDVDWILNLFGLNLDEFAQWNYMDEYSDHFSDASINTTLWTYTGGTIEGIGNITTGGSLLNYYVTNFDFNTSTSWKITFNMSYIESGNEHWIAVCNEKTLDWTKLASGTACTLIAPVGYYYTNIMGMSKLQYYIIINGTNRVISLYNWEGTVNSTGVYTFTNMYLAFGTNNAYDMTLYNFNVYQLGEQPDTTPPNTTQPTIYPSTPKTEDNLQCYATLTDNLQTNLTANWVWYRNNVSYLSGTAYNITNGTNNLITTLSVGNTTKGENWTCEITPSDGINLGAANISEAVIILNSVPTQANPLLTTLSGKNLSAENLTCYNQSTSDADKDMVTNIYNWYKNSQPLTVLNLPFEINANDYSGNNNDGIIYGNPKFVTGKFGRALNFNGINQSINISDSNSLDITNQISIETWIKLDSLSQTIILDKNLAYRLWFPDASGKFVLSLYIGSLWTNISANTALNPGNWYHLTATYNGSSVKLYINGIEDKNQTVSGIIGTSSEEVVIATYSGDYYLNGTIDELKVYPYALTPQQISTNYDLEYNTLISQETIAGDDYMCQVTPNDGEEDGITLNSSIAEVKWGITFNVTSGENDLQIPNFNINCNNSFSASGVSSPYTTGFSSGSYECIFSHSQQIYFNKTINFVADVDKMINVKLSVVGGLTYEEHTWLEAIYNCLYSGDCSLYNQIVQVNQTLNNLSQTVNQDYVLTQALNNCIINGDCTLYNTLMNVNQTLSSSAILTQATYQCVNLGNCTLYNTIMQINNNTINSIQEHTWLQAIYDCTNTGNCTLYNNLYATLIQINQTLVNVWQNIMPTNQSVVIYENVTNRIVNATFNLTINYTINIPIKAGYALGTYLPVRIGFWFLNVSDNRTCFNQGDRPTGVIGPYCQPLIIEVVGPMGGQVNFTVKLRPNATSGNYTIKRIVDIDPNNVWISYGQDIIGTVEVKDNNPSVNTNSQQQNSQISPPSGSYSSSSSKKVTNVYNNNYYTTDNGRTGASQTSSSDGVINLNKPTITGGIIGSLISQGQIMITLGIIGGIIIAFILSKTIIKLKKK